MKKKNDLSTERRRTRTMKSREVDLCTQAAVKQRKLAMDKGKIISDGISIHKIQRRLGHMRLEFAGGWSRVMPGSYQVNGN